MTFFAYMGYGIVKLDLVNDASRGLMQITVRYERSYFFGYYGLWDFDAESTYAVDWLFLVSLFFDYEKSHRQLMEYGVNLESGFTVFLQTMKKDEIAFQRNCKNHPLDLDDCRQLVIFSCSVFACSRNFLKFRVKTISTG